jgi:uncharacterized protein GlcG (DUF336 family)
MIHLDQAQTIVTTALAEGRARSLKPLAVIVLDAGGHPITFAREDNATFFRHDIARAKAYGALGLGQDTRGIAAAATERAGFFQGVSVTVGGNIAFSPGGVLVRDGDGRIMGAVGISGDTGDNDEVCAIAGIKAAGLFGGPA